MKRLLIVSMEKILLFSIIAKEKSGKYGWSWDFIFIPDGYDKTMGNYPDEERCRVWNTDAYYELAKFLEKNNT